MQQGRAYQEERPSTKVHSSKMEHLRTCSKGPQRTEKGIREKLWRSQERDKLHKRVQENYGINQIHQAKGRI